MQELLNFVIEHGYLLIFAWVALDQAGLPLPAAPLIIAAGVLIGMGEMTVVPVVLSVLLATLPIDLFWYWLGKVRGVRVLHLLCILSLEPDYCVRNTEATFRKLGPFSLVVGKFVPGLQTLAPPMSGLTSISVPTFLIYNTIGTVLWTAIMVALGYFFHEEVESIVLRMAELGTTAAIMVGGVIAAYFLWKIINRQRFLRTLRMRRLTPHEVHERLQRGDDLHVIDLRHDYDVKALPVLLPNALRVPMEAIERHKSAIPLDSDILLCCN